ncbi:MAG: HAD family hydrolase [Clostridia bacterium]|nr:HAD family hydrolase [Clostridia bacterium]
MPIRMIATDVDGTILPRGGTISDATRRAVALCRERGIPFVIVSGRWIGALGDVIRQCGTADQPIVIVNGSAVLGPDGAVWHERFMDPADVERVYAVLRRYNVQINSYVPGALYCLNTPALAHPSSMIKGYMGGGRLVIDDRDAFEAEALDRVYKLEGLTENTALIEEVRGALERETNALVTHSSWRNVELMSHGMGKAASLGWLAERLGVDLADCMAFGDNANDLDMLRAVGWPVAVGNATDEVKQIARIVADTDAGDGVAKVIFECVCKDG